MSKAKTVAVLAVVAFCVTLALFEIDVDPQLSLARTVDVVDEEQEARFASCVAERDAVIHEETFSTIDNPDVQREVLATRKEHAKRDCREAYPARTVTVEEPFRFNLIDLEARFWSTGEP